MKKIIVFATSNENKVKEVREMLVGSDYEVLSLKDVNLKVEQEESASTFMGNAKIKALDIASRCSYPVFSDDSGLVINALPDILGVYSARFMEGKDYSIKNKEIIRRLEGVKDRSAAYYAALYYIDKKNNIEKCFLGETKGYITLDYDEKRNNGFGYDPIFFSTELNKCFGSCSASEKDSVSHRGKALRELVAFLKEGK